MAVGKSPSSVFSREPIRLRDSARPIDAPTPPAAAPAPTPTDAATMMASIAASFLALMVTAPLLVTSLSEMSACTPP